MMKIDTGFTSEGVRDSSLNDLRYSDIKVEAIRDCVPEDLQLSYLFPLDKYLIPDGKNWIIRLLKGGKRAL